MLFDNKRKIVDEIALNPSLRDSLPLNDITEALLLRTLSQKGGKSNFHKTLPRGAVKKYKNTLEIGVRNFVKALFAREYNLDPDKFKNYKAITTFVNKYESTEHYRLTANNIATLKRRCNDRVKVPRNKELEGFTEYIKKLFPDFDINGFLGAKRD